MTTDTPQYAGIRWQQIITPTQAEEYRNKTVVFIGLGNSTAEMLVQIQRLNRAGYNIRYKILTHYPASSLYSPRTRINEQGKEYQVYRDIRRQQLTKLAGDLEAIRDAFVYAYQNTDGLGEILPEVEHWSVEATGEEKTLIARQRDGTIHRILLHQLYTLIGYGHPQEELISWGLRPNSECSGTIFYDYDGEVQQAPGLLGRQRISPGYFAFGSLLKSPYNLNAQVIPGMLFRLPDTFAGIVFRAMEHTFSSRP